MRVESTSMLHVLTKNLSDHCIFVIWVDYFKDTLTNQFILNKNNKTDWITHTRQQSGKKKKKTKSTSKV